MSLTSMICIDTTNIFIIMRIDLHGGEEHDF